MSHATTTLNITDQEAATITLGFWKLLARADELEMTRDSRKFHQDAATFHSILTFKIPENTSLDLVYSGSEIVAVTDALEELETVEADILRDRFIRAAP